MEDPEPDDAGPPGDGPSPVPGSGELTAETRRALEAIVMVAADPVPPQMLAQLLEVSVPRIEAECAALAAGYEAEGRGFVLVRIAGGYRIQSHPDAAPYVERYVLEGQSARLSSAALETLAIVAYKQPLSRAQVAAIRGVNVDGVMRTLTHRGLVAEVARDPGPGQAVLYGTTSLFLERLGVDSLDDLPPIAAFVPDASVVEALENSLRFGSPVSRPSAPDDAGDDEDDAGDDEDDGIDDVEPAPTGPGGVDPEDLGPEDVGLGGVDPEDLGPEDVGLGGVDPDDLGPEDVPLDRTREPADRIGPPPIPGAPAPDDALAGDGGEGDDDGAR